MDEVASRVNDERLQYERTRMLQVGWNVTPSPFFSSPHSHSILTLTLTTHTHTHSHSHSTFAHTHHHIE